MDLSKLPKLSQTPAQQPPDAPGEITDTGKTPAESAKDFCRQCGLPLRIGARFCDGCGAIAGGGTKGGARLPPVGPEAWIGVVMGIILLFMTPNTLGYVSSKVFGTTFTPYADPTRPFPAKCDFVLYDDGTKEFYRDRLDFWSDLAVTSFALAMIVEGVALLFIRRRWALMAAMGITIAATLGNLIYVIATTSKHGWPMLSLLAVLIGGYMAVQQTARLRRW